MEANGKLKHHVWQYYWIGDSKQYNVGCEPVSLKADVVVPFLAKSGWENKEEWHNLLFWNKVYQIISICKKSVATSQFWKAWFWTKVSYAKASAMEKIKDNWVNRFSSASDTHHIFQCYWSRYQRSKWCCTTSVRVGYSKEIWQKIESRTKIIAEQDFWWT